MAPEDADTTAGGPAAGDVVTARPPRSVAGRVAVVTGAGSGMGRATARLLGAEGARVACWDVDVDGAHDTAVGIVAADGTAMAAVVDISDEASVAAGLQATRDALGPVDLLVNNAGISLPAALDGDGWREAWDRTLAVNLTGPALVLRACLEDLRRNGDGRVVNLASTEPAGSTEVAGPLL